MRLPPNGHRWESSPKIRFAVDSPLEGRVRSEPVSESGNSLLAGNIQGISSIRGLSRTPIAEKKQLSQALTNQFPTHLNRELFWP